jgi:hypothetical protein
MKDHTASTGRNGNARARNTLKACCPTTVEASRHDLTSSGPATLPQQVEHRTLALSGVQE